MEPEAVQNKNLVSHAVRAFWYFLVPAACAALVIQWCNASPDAFGPLGDFVRDQQIPAAILVLTGMDLLLYSFREHLPLGHYLVAEGADHVPTTVRREYGAAKSLVAEVEQIRSKYGSTLDKKLPKAVHERLDRAVGSVNAAVDREPFDTEEFTLAYTRLQDLVDLHLARYRKGEVREFIEAIATALLFAVLLRTVVVEAFKIPSGSMLPTLQINDHIFVSKFAYGPNIPFTHTRLFADLPPERGDVVVFEFPDVPVGEVGQDFIKRVIALPGDTLAAEDGHPIINGWPVPSCYVGMYPYGDLDGNHSDRGALYVEFLGDESYLTLYEEHARTGSQGPFKVAEGEVWVMGDNRHNSHDSRMWRGGRGGGVPYPNIKGRALFVWLPWSRLAVPVMGKPQVPDGMPAELSKGIERCLLERPVQTVPPTAPKR